MFPGRDTRFASHETYPDWALNEVTHNQSASYERTHAALELETRAWLRDFWSRSIAAWIALVISIISVVIAVCAFFR
jgi:hypothetical protein